MRPCLVLALLLVSVAVIRAGPNPQDGNAKKTDPSTFKFGDIISSTMSRVCGSSGSVLRKHYVVYVGKVTIPGVTRKENQDIFHRWEYEPNGCRFGELSKGKDIQKAEEYDFETEETRDDKIMARIKEMNENCGDYDILDNNCEQTATYIRFNKRLMQQGKVLCNLYLISEYDIITFYNLKTTNKGWTMLEQNKGTLAEWALKVCPGSVIRTCDRFLNMVDDAVRDLRTWKQCPASGVDENNNS